MVLCDISAVSLRTEKQCKGNGKQTINNRIIVGMRENFFKSGQVINKQKKGHCLLISYKYIFKGNPDDSCF